MWLELYSFPLSCFVCIVREVNHIDTTITSVSSLSRQPSSTSRWHQPPWASRCNGPARYQRGCRDVQSVSSICLFFVGMGHHSVPCVTRTDGKSGECMTPPLQSLCSHRVFPCIFTWVDVQVSWGHTQGHGKVSIFPVCCMG